MIKAKIKVKKYVNYLQGKENKKKKKAWFSSSSENSRRKKSYQKKKTEKPKRVSGLILCCLKPID